MPVSGEQQGKRVEEGSIANPMRPRLSRVFFAPWNDRYGVGIPTFGEPYDDPRFPYAVCTGIRAEEDESGHAVVVCSYNDSVTEEFWEYSIDFGVEALNTTKTCLWDSDDAPCDLAVATPYPVMEETFSVKAAMADREAIAGAIGTVNSKRFQSADAGCLLLSRAQVRCSYNIDREIISVSSTFGFVRRKQSHNLIWREATQDRTAVGTLAYYQGVDENEPFYDEAKRGQPVIVAGSEPKWDKPYWMDGETKKYRYETTEFADVLGIPKEPGDE